MTQMLGYSVSFQVGTCVGCAVRTVQLFLVRTAHPTGKSALLHSNANEYLQPDMATVGSLKCSFFKIFDQLLVITPGTHGKRLKVCLAG
jgi:hypothetical protein